MKTLRAESPQQLEMDGQMMIDGDLITTCDDHMLCPVKQLHPRTPAL
jgi:hypothetical protein